MDVTVHFLKKASKESHLLGNNKS